MSAFATSSKVRDPSTALHCCRRPTVGGGLTPRTTAGDAAVVCSLARFGSLLAGAGLLELVCGIVLAWQHV